MPGPQNTDRPLLQRIDARHEGWAAELEGLRRKLSPDGSVVSEAGKRKTIEVFGEPLTPSMVVERICAAVRERGVEAALEYGLKLDGAELTPQTLRVPAADLAAAHAAADPELLNAVRRIRDRIHAFQTAILHADVELPVAGGGLLRQRYVPLERVGVCVPGGAAAYPSTLLMTVVPALAAGVRQIAVVAPPTSTGSYNPQMLAVCHELGVGEVYRIGGAQAVASLAYGLPGLLPKVDKIVGPGNLFVALAKRHVFGEVGIDSIAGPSEVIVLADETTPAALAAADLLAQAEHSPGSAVLITWRPELADAVQAQLSAQIKLLDRGELARQALCDFGACVLVRDRAQGAQVAETLATEHLHIACSDPEDMLSRIRSAGAVFLGPYSPVPVGDYSAGPSHVLPTGATARFASGLTSNDFRRSHSVISLDRAALVDQRKDIELLAAAEGLTAHARAVSIRFDASEPQ